MSSSMSSTHTESYGDNDPIHLFWTGGWDSTFRICQLAITLKKRVQPIYVNAMREAGGQRLCMTHELQAMEYIRADLRRDFPGASRRISPLIMISQSELYGDVDSDDPPPEKIKGPGLGEGWQYSMLGSIAARWDHPIELSIEKSDDGHNPVGDSLIPNVEPDGHCYRLRDDLPSALFDPDNPECICNFRNLRFPLLLTTRPEMREIARASGYLHILEESWSCTQYRPDNTQCGECFCCRGRRRDGVWKERPFDRWE